MWPNEIRAHITSRSSWDCPIPTADFCRLLVRKFAEVARNIKNQRSEADPEVPRHEAAQRMNAQKASISVSHRIEPPTRGREGQRGTPGWVGGKKQNLSELERQVIGSKIFLLFLAKRQSEHLYQKSLVDLVRRSLESEKATYTNLRASDAGFGRLLFCRTEH